MYYGKHASSETRILPESTAKRSRRLRWKTQFVILAAVIVLILGVVGGTTAYLVAGGGSAANTFQYDTVTSKIVETMNNNVKSDVMVKNTGSTSAYIRAAIVVTWQDSEGKVAPEVPVAGKDYTISYGSDWKLHSDGYYYYPSDVAAGVQTTILIDRCTPLTAGPDGYTLHVEILADAIQSSPVTAVKEAWDVTVGSDGKIQ